MFGNKKAEISAAVKEAVVPEGSLVISVESAKKTCGRPGKIC